MPEWGWVIGAGFYTDELEEILTGQYAILKENLRNNILKTIAILFVLLIAALIVTTMVAGKARRDFMTFIGFFESAVEKHEQIDERRVFFAEFKRVAFYANRMIETLKKVEKGRLEFEDQLKKSEERLTLALEGANEGIWDADLVNDIVYRSDLYYEMLDYEPGEIPGTGETFLALIHPDEREKTLEKLKAVEEGTADCYFMEIRLRKKDGSYIWVEGRGRVVERDGENRPLRMLGTHRDISHRKEAERQMLELDRKNSILAMAVTTNHEINQPLSVLKMSIDLFLMTLEMDEMTDKQKKNLSRISKSFEKIEEILKRYRHLEEIQMGSYLHDTDMIVFNDSNKA